MDTAVLRASSDSLIAEFVSCSILFHLHECQYFTRAPDHCGREIRKNWVVLRPVGPHLLVRYYWIRQDLLMCISGNVSELMALIKL